MTPDRSFAGPMSLALHVLADCIAVSLIIVVVLGLLPSGAVLGELRALFVEVWIYTILIATPAHWLGPRLHSRMTRRAPAVQWIVLIAALLAIAVAGTVIGSIIVFALNLEPGADVRDIVAVSARLSLYLTLLVGVIHAMVLLLQDRARSAEGRLRAKELEYERASKLAAEARLAALESRLHPHFLFNALNTLSSLIPSAPARAERLLERISGLLRFSLDTGQQGLVLLEQEMRIVRSYLEVERERFGERLRFSIDAPEHAGLRVPPLSVQTLVENCVKHAVQPRRDGGELRVRAIPEDGHLRIDVSDDGPGFSAAALPAGHGLDNLRSRLALLLGDDAPLCATRHDGWMTVSFRVPI